MRVDTGEYTDSFRWLSNNADEGDEKGPIFTTNVYLNKYNIHMSERGI